jgi:uncharacterized protein (DUF924 family)
MTPADILQFWFDAPGGAEHGQPRDLWFTKSDATDRLIRQRFGPLIDEVLAGGHADWAATPRGSLALVLMLDQFTRNVFRHTPRAFAGDARALALAHDLVAAGDDLVLSPLERWFAYLPFQHSENIGDQDEAVRLFERLAEDGLDAPLEWAIRHRDVIARFGRFPHRNDILGRTSTPAELDFINQPGSRF